MNFQQEILHHLLIIASIALLVYLIIPMAGAFYVRHIWRTFRAFLSDSILYSPLTYEALHLPNAEVTGPYRFFGTIRAIEGDETVWCSNDEVTVTVHLDGNSVYLLSSRESNGDSHFEPDYPDTPPERISWNRLSSLPEYTKIFVSGMVEHRGGSGTFVRREDVPLFVIIYEHEEEKLIREAMWRGRQRNEYWNMYTPGSLAIGSFSLFLYFYLLVQYSLYHLPAIFALTLSIVPLLPVFPPGVAFLYFYRSYWKSGRILRAERDLLRIPTVFFREEEDVSVSTYPEVGSAEELRSTKLASGETYLMLKVPDKITAERIFPEAVYQNLSLPPQMLGDQYYLFGTGEPVREKSKETSDSVSDRSAGERNENERNENEWNESEKPSFYSGGSSLRLVPPRDPTAEALLVPGNPFHLSRLCERRAQRRELIGIFFFGAGLLLNSLIAFVILGLLPL